MLRVESIAALHDELINTKDNPDFKKHLKTLVSSAVDCLASDKSIVTYIDVDAKYLLQKYHLPISLIINEWVTNSIKYALTSGILEISISIKKVNDMLYIEYNDNGKLQQKQPSGLGSEIVNMLCRQISGKLLSIQNNPYFFQLAISK